MQYQRRVRSKSKESIRIPRRLKKGLKKRLMYDEDVLGNDLPKKIIYKGVIDRTADFQLIY